MAKTTILLAIVGLSFAGTCQRPVLVESERARPDPSRLRETEATIRADLEEFVLTRRKRPKRKHNGKAIEEEDCHAGSDHPDTTPH